jgi:SAM-dependent methyltransferase
MGDAYDKQPYTEHAYAETHPMRVAAVARLSGWGAPPPTNARVLELGCGRGGNLLPMAAGLPPASFVGVDRSGRQIADARRVAVEAGLPNVTFVEGSFEALDAALPDGSFDYVVCHGVLSWVPAAARRLLLDRIARALSPGGVAHVSFNVLPGWYERLAARDWLRFDGASGASPAGTATRHAMAPADSLAWLRAQVSPELADYRRRLDAVARRLGETDPAYARHEYLAEEHHPLHVRTFLAEAAAAGLAYLGDALPAATALELLPDEARARAHALDTAGAQQLIDFVRCTSFRRALLVRADESRARSFRAPLSLDRAAFQTLHVASRLRPAAREGAGGAVGLAAGTGALDTFEDEGQSVQVSDLAVRRALRELARVAPAALPFDELVRRTQAGIEASQFAQSLASELLDLWLATGSLDLLAGSPVFSPVFSSIVTERPIACPVARWHAAHGGPITGRLHQEVLVPDAIVRWVLARLDGTRTQADLARDARSMGGASGISDDELTRVVAASLDRLAACALLTA